MFARFLALFACVWLTGSPARALPVFARACDTSCLTCHVLPPRLNAFGEAFREAGYRMPVEDPRIREVEEIALGAEEWKDLFPRGVWPGKLPAQVPLAMRLKTGAAVEPEGAEVEVEVENSIELVAVGDLGGVLAFLAEVEAEEEMDVQGEVESEVAIERLVARVGSTGPLALRVGKFDPASVPFSMATELIVLPDPVGWTTRTVEGGYALGDVLTGAELVGVLPFAVRGGGLRYGLGAGHAEGGRGAVIEGSVTSKFGGLPVGPVPAGPSAFQKGSPRDERSAAISLQGAASPPSAERYRFHREGMSVHARWSRLELLGGA